MSFCFNNNNKKVLEKAKRENFIKYLIFLYILPRRALKMEYQGRQILKNFLKKMSQKKNLELRQRLFVKFISMFGYDAVDFVFQTQFCL